MTTPAGWVLVRSRTVQDLETTRLGRWLLRITHTNTKDTK